MIIALLLIPLIAAVLSLLIRRDLLRRLILIFAAIGHTTATLIAWNYHSPIHLDGFLMLDELGLLFLTITSIIFLIVSFYSFSYLGQEAFRQKRDFTPQNSFINNEPEAIFSACLHLFLFTMTLITLSQHFGLLWVAIEASTLASAPLIYFHRHHRSLEATWKYLLICSVGIALALLGNFFLVIAASPNESKDISLIFTNFLPLAKTLNVPWLKAAFLFFLVGYGTKMGLAPMHTWLPDAYSEAPSMISALLSGAFFNCAFLGLLRVYQVFIQAGQTAFCQELFIIFGVFSMGWAAIFMINQSDYKRMLAYSSLEHIGIMVIGLGVGANAVFATLLHSINHSFTKALLFLVAGNIYAAYNTKHIAKTRGLFSNVPVSGALWLAGFMALSGIPPFGIFLSKLGIIQSMITQEKFILLAIFLVILALIFVSMSRIFLQMVCGEKNSDTKNEQKEKSLLRIFPPLVLGILTLLLGLYIPSSVNQLLHYIASTLGGY